ncbi:MAG: response regulator, partial [Rhodothermia bacterium]|nr:response regulator [Rhodothermia bacterium]
MDSPLEVLVVDDEADVAWLFKQRFRREIRKGQLVIHFALSGQEALDYLRSGGAASVVFVLSDINMPGMTGLELLKAIKEEFPDLSVHMITAYADEKNYTTAMKFGADGYFNKPVDFDSLRNE